MLGEPGVEARGDAVGTRHAANAGRQVHDPPALGDRKLAEQEEAVARRGGDPVGVAATGIEERGLGRPGGLLGEGDQLVLDLERT
jgi:hypothetical protein